MRNFRTVFEFEFFQQIKKRVVIISTIILAIVAFGGAAAMFRVVIMFLTKKSLKNFVLKSQVYIQLKML